MATVTIQHITPEQKKKRIIIQNNFYKLMDKLDGLSDADITAGKKSFNRIQWEKRFAAMSDIDFHEFMKRMKNERDFNISYEAESFTKKDKMSVSRIKKIAKDLKVKLEEYVIYPHKNRENPDRPIVSKTPLMIIIISVKRLQQMLAKKNKVSSNIDTRNELTNTVTGDDKGGRMSNVQTLSLITTNQYAAVKEFLSIRSDNEKAKIEMFKEIEATGKAHISNYNLQTSDMQSVQAMEVFLKGAGLTSNILNQNSQTTQELNKRKKEAPLSLEEYEDFDKIDEKELKNYQVLIFGEIHKDADHIQRVEKIIKNFQPQYLLHEQGIIDKVIDKEMAREMLKINKGKVINHQMCDISSLLNIVINSDCKLVGIDLEPEVLKSIKTYRERFLMRETNMLQRIQQFKNLDNKPRIAVVLGDTHLRYFDSVLFGNRSPISAEYHHDNSVLIIRAPQEIREIDLPIEYIITFDKPILDTTFKSTNSKIYRSKIIMNYKLEKDDNRKYYVGDLFLEKEIMVMNKESNTLEPLLFENQSIHPTFLSIIINHENEKYNFEKIIIESIKKNKELNNCYLIMKKDSRLFKNIENIIKDEKEFTEIWKYIEKDENDKYCIKIK